jgi:hypothetical protein
LVDFAIADVKAKCNLGNKPDCVWIFFDKDSFSDFDEALARIESLNIPKDVIVLVFIVMMQKLPGFLVGVMNALRFGIIFTLLIFSLHYIAMIICGILIRLF